MPKKILILMSKTGGGHWASAEALRLGFAERYSTDVQVDIVDLWIEHTPWPLNQALQRQLHMTPTCHLAHHLSPHRPQPHSTTVHCLCLLLVNNPPTTVHYPVPFVH